MTAYLYVLNTLADWEIAYITAEIYSRRFLDKSKGIVPLIKTAPTLKAVKTMGGMAVKPEVKIGQIDFKEGDLLLFPGGETWDQDENLKVMEQVPKILEKGTIVAAICGATAALAKNGVLNNRKHTSNDLNWLKTTCPQYSGEKLYSNELAVTDGNLITAAGHAPLEFSYEVFKRTSLMREKTAKAWFELFRTREARFFYDLMESLK